MSHLPFIAPPYPDEILGSWLARICLHNAIDGNSLFQEIGFTNPRIQVPFDITPFTERVSILCDILEIGYEQLLLDHTTLPYRLTFNAADIREGYMPGTKVIPKLFANRLSPRSLLHRISHIKSTDRKIRYCPQCLLADYKTYGEPYWHRENQLPNIEHCRLHQVALRHTCPICHRAALLQHGFLELPSLVCICGHDLTKDADDVIPSDGQTILTISSVKALNNHIFPHSFHQIDSFLRSTVQFVGYEKSLTSIFGEFEIENGLYIFHSPDKKLITRIPVKYDFHRPSDCCAALSSIGLIFEKFYASIDTFLK
ncbi:TniQ family protein [Burkholderia cenocepacia]|uniref:TniQ family protein n=1 Tax=Burkholderia cenocepacia TaxID=95486 RepID=UPI0039E01246